jgi:hypothetical protein
VPPIVSKLKGKKLLTDTGIYNVMAFMEAKVRNKELSIPIKKAQLRTTKATGVFCTTVQETKSETKRLDVAEEHHS